MLRLGNVTFDCADPPALAAFWSAALELPIAQSMPYFAMLQSPDGADPRYLFIKVPEGKTVKNRVHIDLRADQAEAEIERLVSLGASRGDSHDQYGVRWTVMQDPEGNEFCVARE
jgi:predicted enzyme related to lactoylglutathione lyase